MELSVKSSSFRANVRAFILALSPEREYLSLTSFSQNCFNILFCSCYLFRSVFFHAVQIVYSDRYFHFSQLWAKDVGAGLRWKAKVSLTIESFEDIPTESIFMFIFVSLLFFLDRRSNSWIAVFIFQSNGVDWRSRCNFAPRNPSERFVFRRSKKEALPGEKGENWSQKS